MFLLESRSEAVEVSVAVEAERAGVVGDGVLVRVDEDRLLVKVAPYLSRALMGQRFLERFIGTFRSS